MADDRINDNRKKFISLLDDLLPGELTIKKSSGLSVERNQRNLLSKLMSMQG